MKDEKKNKSQLIEELNELRRRLAKSEKSGELLQVLDAANDGICIINPDYEIEYANAVLQSDFGPDGATKCYEYFHQRTDVCPWCRNDEVFAGQTVRWEWHSPKTGKSYDLMDTPLYKADGTPAKVEVFRDITRRKHIERSLLESEEKSRRQLNEIEATYHAAGVGLCTLDRELRFTRVNTAFAAMNGISAAEHIGRTVREIAPDLSPKAEELAGRIFRTGEPVYDVEIAGTTPVEPERQRYWIEHWVPIKDRNGNILGINISAEEITELLDMKETIAQSQSLYKELADSITDIFFALDSELRYTFWNKACEAFTGIAASDVLGRHMLDIFPENESIGQTMPAIEAALETGQTQSIIIPIQMADSIHRLNVKVYPATGGLTVFARDITEELQIQELLVTRTAILEAVMENTPAQLAYLDPDFSFLAVNTAYAESAGYHRDAMIGKNHFDIFPHEENRAIFTEVVESGRKTSYIDKPFLFPNQPERGITYWDWSLIPVKDEAGSVIGLVLSLLETTERVIAQENCQRFERLATLGELAGTISHELRNPLATIDNSVYVLKRRLRESDEKIQENLNRIKTSVDRSVSTIQSLLNLTRMKEPARVPLSLAAVVTETLAEWELPADVEVIRDFPAEPVLVDADRELLLMCFGNIIRNAKEAMEGEGTLTITLERTDGWAECAFTDGGPGIPAEHMAQVIKPLFSTKASGAGFGLSIANQVAEKHGGGLKFYSTVGEGTTVTVQLPLSDEQEENHSKRNDR